MSTVTYRNHRDNVKSIEVLEWYNEKSFKALDSKGSPRRYSIWGGKIVTTARTVRGHRGYTLGYVEEIIMEGK